MAEMSESDTPRDRQERSGHGPARALDEDYRKHLQGRLECYATAYQAGHALALYEALLLCESEALPPAGWMRKGMITFMEQQLGKVPQGRGRTGNPLARTRQDFVHYARWDAVDQIREYQEHQRRDKAQLERINLRDRRWQEINDGLRDFGTTLEEAFDHAAELLRGTPAFGSKATIRASYLKVRRAMLDPQQRGRFLIPHPATRRRFDVIS